MSKIPGILILFFLLSCSRGKQPAQVDTTIVAPPAVNEPALDVAPSSDSIVLIRQKVEKINTMELESKHVEFICDEKMMVDYFYAGGEIIKISVDFGTVGDVYAKEDYYYDSGELIFNYEFVQGGPACEGCIETNEYRSYIMNNKVIKYFKNKTEASCRKCGFSLSSRQYKLLTAKTDEEVKTVLCR